MTLLTDIITSIDSGQKAADIEKRLDLSALSPSEAEALLGEADKRRTVPAGNELLNLLFGLKAIGDHWFRAKVISALLQREDIPPERRLIILKTLEKTLAQIRKKSLEPADSRRVLMLEAGYFAYTGKAYADLGAIPEAQKNYHQALSCYKELGIMTAVVGIQARLDLLAPPAPESPPAPEAPATPAAPDQSAELDGLGETQARLKVAALRVEHARLSAEVNQLQSSRQQLAAEISRLETEQAERALALQGAKTELRDENDRRNLLAQVAEQKMIISRLLAQLQARPVETDAQNDLPLAKANGKSKVRGLTGELPDFLKGKDPEG